MSTAGGSSAAYNAAILTPPIKCWRCPNCGREKRTQKPAHIPHVPLHQCPRLRGTWVPFLEEHTKGRLEVVERGDYVGSDLPQTDGEGRPVQAVITHRDSGQDCRILAPCINARVVAYER
jgi:hypothetical protein